MPRLFVFLLGVVLGGVGAYALLLPRLSALREEVVRLKGEVERLSFRLEAQEVENQALKEEAKKAKEELERLRELMERLREKAGLPTGGQGGGGELEGWTGVRARLLDLTLQAYEVGAALLLQEEAQKGEALIRVRYMRPSSGLLRFGLPLSVPHRVSSPFGYRPNPFGEGVEFHGGVDLVAPARTPVLAVERGVVRAAGGMGVYGLAVLLSHPGGYETLYAHLEALAVRPGEEVARGQVLGYLGSTGRSTGPHLHFGLYRDGLALDPWPFLAEGSWR